MARLKCWRRTCQAAI